MKFEEKNHILTVTLDERIDSVNAPQVEEEIFSTLNDSVETVTINAERLEYISSAGLRVLLKLRKNQASNLVVSNVSREVYDIFEVTGFTTLLEVHKSLRELSTDGCEVLGSGGYGTVYRLDADTILKVYRPGISQEFIDGERSASKKAFLLGIPTAIPYDTVKVGEQFGVVYEMLEAKTVAQLITQDKNSLPALGALSANALKEFHQIQPEAGDFPKQKDKYRNWIANISKYLTQEETQKLLDFLDSIPERNTFLHGDYNSKNIMVKDGQVVLIDIGDASIGHPAFDLAGLMMVYLVLPKSSGGPERSRHLLGFDLDLAGDMWNVMCSTYFGTQNPDDIRKITAMLLPVMNMNIAYQGFSRGALTEEAALQKVNQFVRGLLLKSLEKQIPITF